MASRNWMAVPAVLLGFAVAGCVSMPGSGPAVKYQGLVGTSQNQVFAGPQAEPPYQGEDPADIVRGFLAASAGWATDATARDYLTPAGSAAWTPSLDAIIVFSGLTADLVPGTKQGAGQVSVEVSGPQVATLASTGSVQTTQSAAATPYTFHLVKQDGQWRIDRLPAGQPLLLTGQDFGGTYQATDVYYFGMASDAAAASGPSRLVPETVYAPLGASPNTLLTKLVQTLITSPVGWLGAAAATAFPQQGTVVSVSVSGATAVVNLTGTAEHTSPAQQQQMAAQLAWTLAGVPGGQGPITAVKMEINGNASKFTNPEGPNAPPLPFASKQYQAYAPAPDPQVPLPFGYIDGNGSVQSRCGSVQAASVGRAVPVLRESGVQLASCESAGPNSSPSPSSSGTGRHHPAPAKSSYTMVAPSPDGEYVATVSADQVQIWPEGGRHPGNTVSVSGVTSVSWDQQHNLWIVMKGGSLMVLPVTGKPQSLPQVPGLSALSIAPDGVRVAEVVGGQLLVTAIAPVSESGNQTTRGAHADWYFPNTSTNLTPAGTQAQAVSWYDADNLMAVVGGSQIEEVPVNGGLITSPPQKADVPLPPRTSLVSIAAAGSPNMLVVGLSNGQLAVATSMGATWQYLPAASAPSYG